jgi:hypothetical protein
MSRWWRLRKARTPGTPLFGDQLHRPFREAALPTLTSIFYGLVISCTLYVFVDRRTRMYRCFSLFIAEADPEAATLCFGHCRRHRHLPRTVIMRIRSHRDLERI